MLDTIGDAVTEDEARAEEEADAHAVAVMEGLLEPVGRPVALRAPLAVAVCERAAVEDDVVDAKPVADSVGDAVAVHEPERVCMLEPEAEEDEVEGPLAVSVINVEVAVELEVGVEVARELALRVAVAVEFISWARVAIANRSKRRNLEAREGRE